MRDLAVTPYSDEQLVELGRNIFEDFRSRHDLTHECRLDACTTNGGVFVFTLPIHGSRFIATRFDQVGDAQRLVLVEWIKVQDAIIAAWQEWRVVASIAAL